MKKRIFLHYISWIVMIFLWIIPATVYSEHLTTLPVTGHIGYVKDYVNVVYHSNGGDGGLILKDILVETSHMILSGEDAQVKRENHQFVHWNTKPDGSGKVITPGETINLQKHTDLYAQWGMLKSSGFPGNDGLLTAPKSTQLLPRTGEQAPGLQAILGVLVLVVGLIGCCRKQQY